MGARRSAAEDVVTYVSPTSAERLAFHYNLMWSVHGLAWEEWSEDRYAMEALRFNPEYHAMGFHADFKDSENLRLRVFLATSQIRADTGRDDLTDSALVAEFARIFDNTEAMDLVLDGEPTLCILGNWARVGFAKAAPNPSEVNR